MPLEDKDFEQIEEYIKENLPEILARQSLSSPPQVYEIELRERMVRVEEELKNQRDLMKQGFDLMDKRFTEMREDSNRRFEQVDKRFEEMREDSSRRFELVDKQISELSRRMFHFMVWTFGTIVTAAGVIIAVLG